MPSRTAVWRILTEWWFSEITCQPQDCLSSLVANLFDRFVRVPVAGLGSHFLTSFNSFPVISHFFLLSFSIANFFLSFNDRLPYSWNIRPETAWNSSYLHYSVHSGLLLSAKFCDISHHWFYDFFANILYPCEFCDKYFCRFIFVKFSICAAKSSFCSGLNKTPI